MGGDAAARDLRRAEGLPLTASRHRKSLGPTARRSKAGAPDAGAQRGLPFGAASAPPTLSVSELAEDLRDVLRHAFDGLWVKGEIHRPRASQRGHLYFELVEKGPGDRIVGRLDAVVWASDWRRLKPQLARAGQEITDGMAVRCFGGVDVWPPSGRMQLVVRDLDPVWGLGEIERRRRETLAALTAAGLMERNSGLPLSDVPLRVGLVTSDGSAAYHDFLTGLVASGYDFRVTLASAAVQGARAEHEIATALERLAAQAERYDVLVLVRGGGARSDLAAFDSRRVAEAIAHAPLPVVSGVGHEIDRSIADAVAHTCCKTPSEAAEVLVRRLDLASARVEDAERTARRFASRRLELARGRLLRLERLARRAGSRTAQARERVEQIARRLEHRVLDRTARSSARLDAAFARLAPAAARALERRRGVPEALAGRVASVAEAVLAERRAHLDGVARLCQELAPQKLLDRGYSITRDAEGALVRQADRIESGSRLTTRVAAGTITSRVESTGRSTDTSPANREPSPETP